MNTTDPVPTDTDATAEFYTALNDPTRWIIKPGVPVFKPHKRVDPASGKLIDVDLPKLYRIATNMQTMERQGGVPIRMTLGHTEPGKPETQQPPVGGYYRNARISKFGPKGEPAIVVDEWLDPAYAQQRKNFPYRSAEYYDDAEQITGVALLTRDPYLDLGVVAYTKAGAGAVHYSRQSEQPTMYHFLTVEGSMNNGIPPNQSVNGGTVTPPGPTPQQFATPITTGTSAGQPAQTQYTGETTPSQYARPASYTGTWPGPAYRKHNIGHTHPSGGAIYANQGNSNPIYGRPTSRPTRQAAGRPNRYADDDMGPPPPDMGGGPPPGMGSPPGMEGDIGAPGGQDDLQVVHDCLSQAVEALSRILGQPEGTDIGAPPPDAPFPDEGAEEEYSRYASYAHHTGRRPLSRSNYAARRQQMNYAGAIPSDLSKVNWNVKPSEGAQERRREEEERHRRNMQSSSGDPFKPMMTNPPGYTGRADKYARQSSLYQRQGEPMNNTLSGLPVGYQAKLNQLQYQLDQSNHALKVLYYEREQADTEWCASEINRLASMGFQVGEYEFNELKAKPREQRQQYIDHIMTRYQRIGVEVPPPNFMGDPTPGFEPSPDNRPITREEMEQALRMNMDYTQAVQYIRRGGVAPTGPVLPHPSAFAGGAMPGAWAPGEVAPQQLADPYPEPSVNGVG